MEDLGRVATDVIQEGVTSGIWMLELQTVTYAEL